jgi:hypothetical protein
MDCPGKIIQNILRFRGGQLKQEELESLLSPLSLGFYTTLVCECAHASLDRGGRAAEGVVLGAPVDVKRYLRERIGPAADLYYPV